MSRVAWLTIKNLSLMVGGAVAFAVFGYSCAFLGDQFLGGPQEGIMIGLLAICIFFLVSCARSSARFQVDRENFELMKTLRKQEKGQTQQ